MKTLNFLLLSLFIYFPIYSQVTINIPADYPTIQAGIDVASDGDLVLVAEGTYIENINFSGKNITVASHFFVDGDKSHIENTTIDGSQPVDPDNGSTVMFISGEDSTSKLFGFTITGGSGTAWGGLIVGGGIFVDLANPKICNNIIENNIISTSLIAIGGGIGVHALSSPLIISDNIIRDNLVKSTSSIIGGGGIFIASLLGQLKGEVIIRNNLIENNRAISQDRTDGGGILINGWDDPNFYAYIISNKIVGNVADTTITESYGGGLSLYNTHAYVENNIVAYNIAYRGAGIDNSNLGGNSNTYYTNNTICYNYAVGEEGGISTSNLGQVLNCIVWGNTPNQFTPGSQVLSITYSLIGDPYTGTGNIIGMPFFLDSIYFFMHADSTLSIDAGNPDLSYNDVEDPMNPSNPMWPALGLLTNDIGHFGGPNSLWYKWQWPLYYLPSAPVLIAPSDTANTSTFTFVWSKCSPMVTKYWFELDTTDQFTSSFIDSLITDTTYLYSNLVDGKNYWWRVRAYNDFGWGEFSEVGTFSVVITSVENEKQGPITFNLSQNYPNPFNPSTLIQYSIPKTSRVNITIYDVLGNEVSVILNEEKLTGNYEIEFSAADLPSGVYFYQLKTGNNVRTKKMILMK